LRVLRDFLYFTVPNARGADLHSFAGALDEGPHRLEIDIPASLGDVMSVADTVAKLRPATTYFANLCHKTEISQVVRTRSIAKLEWPVERTWGRRFRLPTVGSIRVGRRKRLPHQSET
jgi:hypothetical protein